MIIFKEEIKQLIPHRDPFLFVDSCEIIKNGHEAIGLKKFQINEYFFEGHFPNMPIVPGVILIEAMAQTAGIVISKEFSSEKDMSVLFMSVSKAKFRKSVLPGYTVSLNVKLLNKVKTVYKFSGEGYHNNIKVCESIFSAMISNN